MCQLNSMIKLCELYRVLDWWLLEAVAIFTVFICRVPNMLGSGGKSAALSLFQF